MATPSTAPFRILVVDDDVASVRVLSSILNEMGEVFFATNGPAALKRVHGERPDLVLLDAEMPGMDGFAVCATLKSDPQFQDLPILFVTAHSDIEFETRALELGAVDFISKPFSPAIVKARVKTHLTLKQRTDALNRLVSQDSLTGIANRRAFDKALDAEMRRAHRAGGMLSLLMIDVDFFKRYNDHYGHPAGDDCLRRVASALAGVVKRPGELVARFGGEEFAVVLPACTASGAILLAEKLRAAVADMEIPHAQSDVCSTVTISLGIANHTFGPDEDATVPTLVQDLQTALLLAADHGLYQAKRTGRNRAVLAEMTEGGATA
ncbi:MAG: diguanylate cyclase [Azospirillaceae bacterium]|nr:diguanylate cyclase [Azospirillaceae bacterium]